MKSSIFSCLFVAAVFAHSASAQCATWETTFNAPGVNGFVYALHAFDDGSGPSLVAGGQFGVAGGTTAGHVARWNGTSWAPLSVGFNAAVTALSTFDDGSGSALYAGGTFSASGGTPLGRIAKWNGSNWSALGSGVISGQVSALQAFDDGTGPALYVGGTFTSAGGVAATTGIARWNGASWSSVGNGTNGSVSAFRVFDDGSGPALFAGGIFTSAGSNAAQNIAKWNGTSWSALGGGISGGAVKAFEVFDDGTGAALIAGGSFTSAGGNAAQSIAKWNGSAWTAIAIGPNGFVNTLRTFDDGSGPALFVGGQFAVFGGITAHNAARWNGVSWSALGQGFDTAPMAFETFDHGSGAKLFAGGVFSFAGAKRVNEIAQWNGADWDAGTPGSGLADYVIALRTFDDGSGPALFAGGIFTAAGPLLVSHVAKWNGTSWSALGFGVNQEVDALEPFDDGSGSALCVGGKFTVAGSVGASRVAKWNGTTWSALGSGLDKDVYALRAFDDGSGPALYAGGDFQHAGGTSTNYIAKWNGSSWSPLGSGMDFDVLAMQPFDDGTGPALYAGGQFTAAGGTSAVGIARWNGTSWSAVGGGVNGSVFAFAVFDDGSGPALFAGGQFSSAGAVPASCIAKWNGSTWSAVGGGVDALVRALTVFDDGSGPALYAGGSFTMAGGVPANHVAKWNGTNWSSVGTRIGMDSAIAAFERFDDGHDADADLFAGGFFAWADGNPSAHIAQWHGCGTMSFCFGDGSATSCPCANNGSAGHGCDNSSSTGGALLSASGVASLASDTVLFTATSEKPSALSILSQGQSQISAVPFGQGLRCVAGNLKRLYIEHAVLGAFSAPTGAEPKVHARSAALGDTIPPGSARYYYSYYRDQTVLGGCSPASTFNTTQSLRLIWAP